MTDHKKLHEEALNATHKVAAVHDVSRQAAKEIFEAYLLHVRAGIDDAENVREMAGEIVKSDAECVQAGMFRQGKRDPQGATLGEIALKAAQAASHADVYRKIIRGEG